MRKKVLKWGRSFLYNILDYSCGTENQLWKERWYALQENFVTVGSDSFLELLADDDVLYLTDNGISSEGGELC